MSLFSRLFGGGSKSDAEPETHNGFSIYPEIGAGGNFRIRARIEKEIDGVRKSYTMMRVDQFQEADIALQLTLQKARQVIDEQGDTLFD